MERRGQPIGFMIKQINNVYEKDLNERLRTIGITASQCAVLDYLFHTSKEEVSQRESYRDRPFEASGREGLYPVRSQCK